MNIDQFKNTAIAVLEFFQKQGFGSKTVDKLLQDLKEKKDQHLFHDLEILEENFKKIALEILASYKTTNENFKDIAKEQVESLAAIKNEKSIDVALLEEKFSLIKEHMIAEVKKANSQIDKLSKKVKELEEESTIDPLTKVFNRRALEQYLTQLSQKEKLHHELHVLVLDLDDFKKINDTYGHIVGDKILIFVAQNLKKMLRDGDKVFRFGGEEFVIILNRISQEQCELIAKRILEQISSNKLIYQGETITVTVSIGATKFEVGDSPESVLARADEALYKAKHNGKNRIVIS